MEQIQIPIHPIPKIGDSIGTWLEKIASANKIVFSALFCVSRKDFHKYWILSRFNSNNWDVN